MFVASSCEAEGGIFAVSFCVSIRMAGVFCRPKRARNSIGESKGSVITKEGSVL